MPSKKKEVRCEDSRVERLRPHGPRPPALPSIASSPLPSRPRSPLQKSIEFISSYAFVFVGLEGQHFWGACKETFSLIIKYPAQAISLDALIIRNQMQLLPASLPSPLLHLQPRSPPVCVAALPMSFGVAFVLLLLQRWPVLRWPRSPLGLCIKYKV